MDQTSLLSFSPTIHLKPDSFFKSIEITNKKTPIKGVFFIGDALLAIYELEYSKQY